jgi:capsular exopolysaccharide synthesis family protein
MTKAPGSIVERASERLRRSAPPAPSPLRGPVAAPPPPALRYRTALEITLDRRRLARAGIFSPATHANRTTEEVRLVKQAAIRRSLDAQRAGLRTAPLIMVTSTREGEGKSFIAANLAVSLAAEEGRSVVLIDADPSRSAVASIFGIVARRGLLDAIADERIHPHDVLIGTDIDGLYIVPAGHQNALSAELFASDRTEQFLQRLVAECPGALLILDAPPVLATSEASALARQAGQILYVVEAERIGRREIAEALDLISVCPSIGFVLNKVRFQFGSVRFGNYYRYYRRGRRGVRGALGQT